METPNRLFMKGVGPSSSPSSPLFFHYPPPPPPPSEFRLFTVSCIYVNITPQQLITCFVVVVVVVVVI